MRSEFWVASNHRGFVVGQKSTFFQSTIWATLQGWWLGCALQLHLAENVNKVILQKSIPAQIRQFILYYDG